MKQKLRIIGLLLSLVILAALFVSLIHAQDTYKIDGTPWDGESVATSFAAGDGSADRPYVIASAAQLAYFKTLIESGNSVPGDYYILGADINLNENLWNPIGPTASTDTTPCFSGTFDGRGHTIKGLNIKTASGTSLVGLFGGIRPRIVTDPDDPTNTTTYTATIQNIVFENANINPNHSGANYGVVVGQMNGGKISGIIVASNCSVSGKHTRVGGIVGQIEADTIVEFCVNNAEVETTTGSMNNVGGIVGVAANGAIIRYCVNNGEIKDGSASASASAGGIVGNLGGANQGGLVQNCYNNGIVNAAAGRTGGIVGCLVTAVGKTKDAIENVYNLSSNISSGAADKTGQILGSFTRDLDATECVGLDLGEGGLPLYGSNPAIAVDYTVDPAAFGVDTAENIRALCDVIDDEITNGIAALNAIVYYPDGLETVTDEVTLPPLVTPPADTTAAATTPVETTPVETTPVETTPVVTTPEETTPVETTPEETTPEETTPEETTPEETTPEETTPEETTPNETTDPGDKKKGCGSSAAAIALMPVLAVAVLAVRRKEKN